MNNIGTVIVVPITYLLESFHSMLTVVADSLLSKKLILPTDKILELTRLYFYLYANAVMTTETQKHHVFTSL